MCLPARLVVNEATGMPQLHEGPVRQGQHTGCDLISTSIVEVVQHSRAIRVAPQIGPGWGESIGGADAPPLRSNRSLY
jgi:hypothetical protein